MMIIVKNMVNIMILQIIAQNNQKIIKLINMTVKKKILILKNLIYYQNNIKMIKNN